MPRTKTWYETVFALTTTAEVTEVLFSDDQERSVRIQPTEQVLALVREQRQESAQLSEGAWWRLVLTLSDAGAIELDYDYGDEPFPDDQLFPPEVYLSDLDTYPSGQVAGVAGGLCQARWPAIAHRAAGRGPIARPICEACCPSETSSHRFR